MKAFKDHDITGFVNFPHFSAKSIKPVDCGSTHIYMVAFNADLNHIQSLPLIGNFCGDDVTPKQNLYTNSKSIEAIINELTNNIDIQSFFKNDKPFPVISSIFLGWSKYSYEYTDRLENWCCTFRELTNEGRKLYYSLKKLHNESEIRLFTFNNIK